MTVQDDETVTCTECGAEINWLAVFPKGRCVACHEKHFVMPKSGAEVVRAFAGSVNVKGAQ